MNTALSRAAVVHTDPFPHVVVENALPRGYYDALAAQYPDHDVIASSDRGMVKQGWAWMPAVDAMRDERISLDWCRFMGRHSGTGFADEMLNVFADSIRAMPNPCPSRKLADAASRPVVAMRYVGGEGDVVVESQFASVMPDGARTGPLLAAHVDRPRALIAGMMYFPISGEEAGGSLLLHEWSGARRFDGRRRATAPHEVNILVPYRANVAVFWLNSPDALHSVGPGEDGVRRRSVNFILETPWPNFHLDPSH